MKQRIVLYLANLAAPGSEFICDVGSRSQAIDADFARADF